MRVDPNKPSKPYVSGSERSKAWLGANVPKAAKAAGKAYKTAVTTVYTPGYRIGKHALVPAGKAAWPEVKRASSTSGGQVGRKQRARRAASEQAARSRTVSQRFAAGTKAGSAGRVVPLWTGEKPRPTAAPVGFVGGVGAKDAPKAAPPKPRVDTPGGSRVPAAGRTAPASAASTGASKPPKAAKPGSITTTEDMTKLSYWIKRTEGKKNAKNKAYALMKRAQKAQAAGTLTKNGKQDVTQVLKKSWGQKAYKKEGF